MLALGLAFFIALCLCARWRGRMPSLGAILALGLAGYALTGLGLGLLGASPAVFRSLLFAVAIMAWFLRGPQVARRAFVVRSSAHPSPGDRLLGVITYAAIPLAAYASIHLAGTPLLNYDVLSYHLPLAESFTAVDGGRQVLLAPETFYARMPLAVPIIEAAVLRRSAAGYFGLGAELQFLLAVALFATSLSAGRVAAWLGARKVGRNLATVIVLLHPMMLATLVSGLSDIFTGLFAIASLELLLAAFTRRGRPTQLLAAGLLAGGAATLKFGALGIATVPLLAIAVFLAVTSLHQPKRIVLALVLVVCGVTLALAPWFFRAWIAEGNPLAPFRGAATGWTAEQAAFVVGVHHPRAPFSASWLAAFLPRLATIGLPLLLASFLIVMTRRRWVGLVIIAAALAGYAAWLLVELNPDRFLVPVVVLLIPIVARAVTPTLRLSRFRWIIQGASLIATTFILVPRVREQAEFQPVYRTIYREEYLGFLGEEFMRVVHIADADSLNGKLLLFFEARRGMFATPVTARTVWDTPPYEAALKHSHSPEEFGRELRRQGFTGIFVNEFEWGRLLDFYANHPPSHVKSWMREVGIGSQLGREEIITALAAYPPHRFAGFSRAQLEILHDFLFASRRSTIIVAPAGNGSEIWYARLTES